MRVPRPLALTPRKRWVLLAAAALLVAGSLYTARRSFPSDRTPEGAYLRIAIAVNKNQPRDFFAYLESAAQHAVYSMLDYRRRGRALVLETYPEPARSRAAEAHAAEATAPDAEGLFAAYARDHGFLGRLRNDLSGIAKVEVAGERATIETSRGTRYAFRRRENGIWGLTLFTAVLRQEAERAARDYDLIEQAARDYERAKITEPNAAQR